MNVIKYITSSNLKLKTKLETANFDNSIIDNKIFTC